MRRYLEIAVSDLRGAESYLINLVNPKLPLQLALAGEETGLSLGMSDAID